MNSKIWVEEEILRIKYFDSVTLETFELKKIHKECCQLTCGKTMPIIVEATNGIKMTSTAIHFLNRIKRNNYNKAVAIITDNLPIRLDLIWFKKHYKPNMPLSAFKHEEAAKNWLKTILN